MNSMMTEEKQWDAFLQDGLPSRKDERWKYTDLSVLTNKKFANLQWEDVSGIEDAIQEFRLQQEESILLVFINGQWYPDLSDMNHLPEDVIIERLHTVAQEHPDIIKQYLPKAVDAKLYPFVKLNAALCTEGLFIYIPTQCELTKPLHLLSIVTNTEEFAAHPRHIIALGEHSKAIIFAEHIGQTQQAYFMNIVTNIFIGKEAQLHYYKLQQEADVAVHMANTFVDQQSNSQFVYTNVSLGSEFARDDIVIKLLEPGANCQTAGFYHLRHNNQYIDNHVDINHIAPRSNSEMLYKGILDKKSRAVFNGRLHIVKDAQKILAYQANHNLLLSNEAEVYSKPELEIYADDVKCKHGASTGQIDQDAIFYLRSRGIPEVEAVQMLLQGFADDVLQKISHQGIKQRVQEVL